MGFIRFVLWTSCCVALGVFLASYEVEGRTAIEHFERAWKQHRVGDSLERLKGRIQSAATGEPEGTPRGRRGLPSERHTDDEREAVNKLIANGAQGR
jgi:hypothetical protein